MTRTISLITATVGVALLFAVPAWGDNGAADKPQGSVATSPDWFERAAAAAIHKQDVANMLNGRERAGGVTSAPQQSATVTSPDWFERAAAAAIHKQDVANMLNGRERAGGVTSAPQQSATVTSPDWFERAAAAAIHKQDVANMLNGRERAGGVTSAPQPQVFDARSDHSNDPVTVSATSTGRDIEWPTIGIGFGIGLVLLLGITLAMKATHTRPFAH